jgi:hypothetical protein
MLLGHWYLIDPKLPRRPLRRLAMAGAAGLVLDGLFLGFLGAVPGRVDDPLLGWVFVVTLLFSVLLMVGVWFSLREPSYPGVMAATGLSYLALLTALAAASVGRVAVTSGTTVSTLSRIAGS